MKEKFTANYVIYSDDWFLEESVKSSIDFVDRVLIARTLKPWNGKPMDLTETEKTLSRLKSIYGNKIEIFEGEFENEQEQRNFLIEKSRIFNYNGAFIIDADEIFLPGAFNFLYKIIQNESPLAIRTSYLTFIKDASFNVAPPFETNLFYISLMENVKFEWARKTNVEPLFVETDNPEILHFSYLRKNDADIRQKIENFMHNNDADWEKWFDEVYKKFNKNLKNFHPVWPESWSGLELFDVEKFPPSLYKKLKKNGKLFYRENVLNNSNLKLHLGCGDKILDGYINIDYYNPKADLTLDITDLSYFDDSTIEEIFMNAVFEHIYSFEQIPSLLEWKRILKPGGKLIINSIPDFDIYAKAYLDKASGNLHETFDLNEVMRYTHGNYNLENKFGQIHKDIFNKEKVKNLLLKTGYRIEKIENVHWEKEPIPCNINVTAFKPEINGNNISEIEEYIEKEDFLTAESILKNIISNNPTDVNSLIDLSVVKAKQNNFAEAEDYLQRVIEIDPNNEIAINNYLFLAEKNNFKIKWNRFENVEQYKQFYEKEAERLKKLNEITTYFQNNNPGIIEGICSVCGKKTKFAFPSKNQNINWREELICPGCQLNSRQRGILHFLITETNVTANSDIYLTEQLTPLFNLLKTNFKNVIGSEFLSNEIPPGESDKNGIRNEDATTLTFKNSSFDFILALETLEHIPEYKKALAEFLRTLKANGILLITAPFLPFSERNAVKAFVKEDGEIITLGKPEIHGDPNNPEQGSLCFYHFGWELLKDMRNVGFKEAFNLFYLSRFYGYLTLDNLIVGIK